MPNPLNNIRNEQWDICDRCGFLYPMSELIKQEELLVCTEKCVDNLEIKRRAQIIEKTLANGVLQEGVDLRVVDRGFWQSHEEETY